MAPAEPPKPTSRSCSAECTPTTTSAGNEAQGNSSNEHGMAWYLKSWPRKPKAPAVTQLARESISATGPVESAQSSSTTSLPSMPRPLLRSPTLGLIKKGNTSTRSLPADVTTTKVNIASTRSLSVPKMSDQSKESEDSHAQKSNTESESSNGKIDTPNAETKPAEIEDGKESAPDNKEENATTEGQSTTAEASQETQPSLDQQSSGWFTWFSRPKSDPNSLSKEDNTQPEDSEDAKVEQSNNQSQTEMEQSQVDKAAAVVDDTVKNGSMDTSSSTHKRQTWFQMLTSSNTGTPEKKKLEEAPLSQETQLPVDSGAEPTPPNDSVNTSGKKEEENADDKKKSGHTAKPSSGWIFWSREQPSQQAGGERDQPSGEDANEDISTRQESRPTTEAGELPGKQKVKKQTKKAVAQGPANNTEQAESSLLEPAEREPAKYSKPSASRKTQVLPNQLLPLIKDTFPTQGRPGLIQQLNRWMYASNSSQSTHVELTRQTPRVKKALAIGVHGYFPAPFIRTVLGQPTGTSVKFSDQAAQAISEWAHSRNNPCEIEKIALEGEGRIEERLDLLWKLLLNWIEHIRTADFIMVACHSQGVPVATMLVAKLIAFGCVNSARIGICAMAGVNLGPFPDYRSRWISGSAGELFDFADPTSEVSKAYQTALKRVLDFGVRMTYVGSIDDQLVSLESATFASVSHPHIYRAVFVDGRVHAPSFLSHLVGFAMKLRNLGISDHGLIRELSTPLAGSLYSGEGHSRLYDDEAVYRLAVEYTLETTSVANAVLDSQTRHYSPTPNPYILPFAMRGVLEEEYVRRELSEETTALLKQFEEWKPSSKVLKDVKFRLEGIRSKL